MQRSVGVLAEPWARPGSPQYCKTKQSPRRVSLQEGRCHHQLGAEDTEAAPEAFPCRKHGHRPADGPFSYLVQGSLSVKSLYREIEMAVLFK